jgi:glycine/D-amino acid oxidase-like deaminating enzyme
MADRTAMAKANARGASPSEIARGNKIADELGVDLETGQPLQTTGGLTESELQRRREFAYKQEQDILAGETKAKETEDERSVNRAKAVGSLQALKADLDLIKETGEEVRTLTLKPRTEGLLAKALATVSPTSTAAQLERASGVLTGDAFIKGMQVIKAFGGGLGSVTEVEGLKVERAQGAIFESGMGDEERRQAVKDYIQVRENAYNRIREAFVKEYGETDAQTYLGTQNANATTKKAVPNDRNVATAADTLLSDPKYNK